MEKQEPLKEHEEPLKTTNNDGPPVRHIMHQHLQEDDDTNYFMSEPSMSEAESSEYVRPAHIPSLLAPRVESPSSGSSKDLLFEDNAKSPPPPPQRNHPLTYPSSPGTSLSSWDSPHLFRKQVQLFFSPDKGSKNLEVPAIPNNKRRAIASTRSSSSESTMMKRRSDQFLSDLKQQSVGALKDARPEDFDSDRSNVMNGRANNVDAVIRGHVAHHPTDTPPVQRVDTDPDETIVMDLSTDEEEEEDVTKTTTEEPLDWEAKHSADDEKTTDQRPRRILRKGGGHRRTRSGDAAAASLMTGGKEWKGMQFDRLPIPSEHEEEDEHDQSHDSEEQQAHKVSAGQDNSTLSNVAVEATSGSFAVGASGKNLRVSKRPRRFRRPIPRGGAAMEQRGGEMEGAEDRMSRDAFSRFALESPRAVPKYIGRASPTNDSLSTIDHYTSERMESDSSGHGPTSSPRRRRATSDVLSNRGRRTYSETDIFQPPLERRVSEITMDSSRGSNFSWLSSNNREPQRPSSWDPQQAAYRYNEYPVGEAPETLNGPGAYQFGHVEDVTPDESAGSEYSRSDDGDERDIHSNRLRYGPDMQLDELERLLEDKEMRGKAQHVLRSRKMSPFQKLGKMASPSTRRASYMPTSHSVGDYPTFVCPVCKTRQREFFTVSSAPSQFQGPTGYLALYFAIYVIAALFIFGLEEGWQALDCVYFAVITLTTAGLGDFVPTSDGAKILCSIFIYFGVACIGLLLGSYLASMLDEKSYKQAQRNRVENCTNCARLKNIKTVQMRKQKEKARHKRQSSLQGQSSLQAQAMRGFMSERTTNDVSHPVPHVLEREQKRVRTQRSPKSQRSASAVPDLSESSARSTFNADSSSADASHKNEGNASDKEGDKDAAPVESQQDETNLEVIDSYTKPFNIGSPEATTTRKTSTGSTFGSPLTAQILGRQSHTRHMSLGVNDLEYTENKRRPRKYSEDLGSRPQFAQATIPEDTTFQTQSPKSWTQQTNTIEESESEEDSDDDESSTESEISTDSDATLDEAARRIKTAKYVFLTLKQALMNSVLIILIGGLGFYTIERMSAVDSFYFTTVLLTTGTFR